MRSSAPVVLSLCIGLVGCDGGLNRDIVVDAGAQGARGGFTVNGRIEVGDRAEVGGDLRTVNGSVRVGAGARTRDLDSINGSISLAERVQAGAVTTVNGALAVAGGVRIAGSLGTVNGAVRGAGGSIVDGDVRTVNGPIELRGVTVKGRVGNHAGDLRLLDGSLVEGDVELEEPDQAGDRSDVVVIGVGAQVRGVLRVARPVRLFVHPSARIGRVEGATPVAFEGTDVAGE
jgi:DUF4097 and DUF4098 domain-containing protein YvlB